QERSALYESSAAVPEAFFGNAGEARRRAMAALELSKSRDAEYGAASALAVAGDASSSQARGRFGTALPGGHICQIHYLPTLRALLALRRGGPSMASELLKTASL